MEQITIGQKVRALSASPHGMKDWEKELIQKAHFDSCHGIKPYKLSLRQVELVNTIFHRIYHV